MTRIQPSPTPTSAHYWEGCNQGELRLQRCNACQQHQFYPRIVCSHCQSDDLRWVVAAGIGQVASFTIMRHSVSTDYPTPQVIALIDLAEGPRMMGHIVGDDMEVVAIGDAVTVHFENWGEDTSLPVWRKS